MEQNENQKSEVKEVFDHYRSNTYVRPYASFAPEMKKVKPIKKEQEYISSSHTSFKPYVPTIEDAMNMVCCKNRKQEREM